MRLFRYAFSHDLKRSLRPVLGFGHYLEAGEVSSAHTGELQNKMVRAATVLERQLDALAEYVGLCLRASCLHLQATDLSTLLPSVVAEQLARFGLWEECVEVVGMLPPVMADKGLLKIIFRELISNGLAFTQVDQFPRVRISCRRQGDRIETLIQDSGLGIPADRLALLGKPFQRFHDHEHLTEGLGLGLTLTTRALAAVGGRLLYSRPAKQGSLFLVSLRAA